MGEAQGFYLERHKSLSKRFEGRGKKERKEGRERIEKTSVREDAH